MAIELIKGKGVELREVAPNLNEIMIGLGWEPKGTLFGWNIDIDASVICINEYGEHVDTIAYYNLMHPSGAIKHNGDNLTGAGKKNSDKEQIDIILNKIPRRIERLSIIVNIYNAYRKKQHFGKVDKCFVRVVDISSGQELVRYDVDSSKKEDVTGKTGLFVGDIYRSKGSWKFRAIGQFVKVQDILEMISIKCV